MTEVLTGLTIPNGLDWTADGRELNFIDTPTRRVDRFEVGPTGRWAVERYAPDGRLDRRVELPAAQVTCCTFGGPDLAQRSGWPAVTSRSGHGSDEPARTIEPSHEGETFVDEQLPERWLVE